MSRFLPRSAGHLACLALAALLAATAHAQQAGKPAATPQPAPPGAGAADPAASADQLFTLWDTDKNGQLTRKEFNDGWEQAREVSMLNRLETQFKSMDLDHSGALEASEYASLPIIKRAGAGAPPLSVFDADKNGKMDFREYLALVQAIVKRSAASGQ